MYDYLRCPKIVSIRTYRNLKKPKTQPQKKLERNIRYEIGTIGEVLTKKMFDGSENNVLTKFEEEITTSGGFEPSQEIDSEVELEFDEGQELEEREEGLTASYDSRLLENLISTRQGSVPPIQLDLSQRGIQLDSQMNEILKNTILGLAKIKKYLRDEYGELTIIGRGESKNGLLPNKIRPDFVAISENKKPILIEVKNSATLNKKGNQFQAAFYNTIAKKYGVVVLEERLETDSTTIIPKTIHDPITETLLIYPRLGIYKKIDDTIPLDKKLVDEVWRAKQLGLQGRSPKTDCGSSCPHHRLGELPDGNLETAIPLSLIYAEGLVEQGVDLDLNYLRGYFWKIGMGSAIRDSLWDIRHAEFMSRFRTSNQSQKQKNHELIQNEKEKFIEETVEKTGFDRKTIEKLFSESSWRSPWKEIEKIDKEFHNELNPWEKLLGAKNLKKMKNAAKGNATKLYPIPDKSEDFIRKSWKAWAK